MTIDIDIYLVGEDINTSPDHPVVFEIMKCHQDTYTDPKTGKEGSYWAIDVRVDAELRSIRLNKTSLRNCVKAFGKDEATWAGKKIDVFTLDQQVQTEMKKVIYVKPHEPGDKH